MKHVLARVGAVGLLGGGLVASSAGTAFAKSDLTLHAGHTVIKAGDTMRFAGSAGDDAGIRKALFCLQVRWPGGHWAHAQQCVKPYRTDTWNAAFRFRTGPLARGRYAFRAVGVDSRHRKEVYGPSAVIGITVR